MANPATNTTTTTATASAALNHEDMRGSFHRRRHAGRWRDGARVRRLRRRQGPRPASGRRRARRPGGVRCLDRRSCRSTSQHLGACVRLERGPHRAVGVMQSGADRARRDAEDLGDLRWGVAREMVQGEHDPLVGRQPPESAFELVPVGDREDSSGAAGPSIGSSRRLATRRRSRPAWRMQTLIRSFWSHASNRSGSRSACRSRQAITSASWKASSARSTSRRIRCAIANSRSARGRTRSTYASRSPRWAASTRSRSTVAPLAPSRGRRPTLLVAAERAAFRNREAATLPEERPRGTRRGLARTAGGQCWACRSAARSSQRGRVNRRGPSRGRAAVGPDRRGGLPGCDAS